MNDRFINWDLEGHWFLNWNYNVLHHFEGNLLDLGNMDRLLYGIRHRFLNWDGDFFDDGYDDRFGHWDLDWYRVGYRDYDWLVDFELYVLWDRDDYFFVMLDGFRGFFFYVVVDWVGVDFQVVASEAVLASEVVAALVEAAGFVSGVGAEVKAAGVVTCLKLEQRMFF